MKKLSILFVFAGIILLCVGGYRYFTIQAAEDQAMNEAQNILTEAKEANQANQTSQSAKSDESVEPVKQEKNSFQPETGDVVGVLEIPELNAELPIIEGTDPDELEKGVGHYKSSAYPEQSDQVVLSGHRDTVFRNLGELKNGDTFIVKLSYGDFEYEMVSSKIVDADDTTVIKSTAPREELVITTCYPFSYIGNAAERYIIYAKPVY
ncbi:class D sortase [Gracilibacillus oryzae]|uniref:Class D sortase n=1 Tax=Gracilibacillus oryzae TaxID=1672701 RepID=A0A7C8GVL8_9BACI|nr:class D sortase [Gracilibacillus oryzae]KAB8139380.1 class D sortase [Gracilibacillus oryzae]